MNIVMAMTLGADDFIAKPFDLAVLTAKIQALLRRSYDFAGQVPVLGCRGVLLNTGDGTLTYEGNTLELSKNEFRILQMLLENRGKTVSPGRADDPAVGDRQLCGRKHAFGEYQPSAPPS